MSAYHFSNKNDANLLQIRTEVNIDLERVSCGFGHSHLLKKHLIENLIFSAV